MRRITQILGSSDFRQITMFSDDLATVMFSCDPSGGVYEICGTEDVVGFWCNRLVGTPKYHQKFVKTNSDEISTWRDVGLW